MTLALPRRRALDHLVRPTRAEVSVSALRHNLSEAKRHFAPAEVMCVVKANAYGHGAVQVARVLEQAGAAMLGVALVEEGVELRNAGVRLPILVMSGAYEDGYELLVGHQLTPVVFLREHLDGLSEQAQRFGRPVPVHLKLDTGMSRIGVQPERLPALLQALKAASELQLEGFLTHFASAEDLDSPLTDLQLKRFREGLQTVREHGFAPTWRHAANTAGSLARPEARDGLELNLVRPGGLLYGLKPPGWDAADVSLEPVLTWKTGITHLKTIEPGTSVSYGGIWTAKRRTALATLPVGYADGYHRAWTNKASVLIRGRRVPVVGRVTMDMILVDVTDVPNVALRDEVVLLGQQGHDRVSAEELAIHIDSVHYEVLCGLGARVPRVLVTTGGGEVVAE